MSPSDKFLCGANKIIPSYRASLWQHVALSYSRHARNEDDPIHRCWEMFDDNSCAIEFLRYPTIVSTVNVASFLLQIPVVQFLMVHDATDEQADTQATNGNCCC